MSDGLLFQTVEGIVLPAWDTHFGEQIQKNPLVGGLGTYQAAKLYNALAIAPGRRRLAVDVGAHVGLWTRVLAKEFDRVVAIEPVLDFVQCLWRNVSRHSNVEIHQVALGNDTDTDRLGLTYDSNVANASVCRVGEDSKTTVDMIRLDDLALDGVDFLKLDVEGFEYFILLGGEETIRRDRPVIVVEHKKKLIARYDLPLRAPLDLLESWGATEMWSDVGDHCYFWGA